MYVLVRVAAGVGMSGLATSGPSSSSYAGQVLADMVSGPLDVVLCMYVSVSVFDVLHTPCVRVEGAGWWW